MAAKTAKGPAQPAAAANAASLYVSLPQLLDLALGTPEVGAVNLNILHNFLHVLLHQINLRSTKVEYRGDDANRVKTMVASLKAGPALHLHEYSITEGSGKVKHRIKSTDSITVNVDILADENAKAAAKSTEPAGSPATQAQEPEKEPDSQPHTEGGEQASEMKRTKGIRQEIGPGTEGECQTVIFVEPIVDGTAPTALGFKQLEQSVNELRQRFQALEELPTNPELIDRVKGKSGDSITEMWQIINITNRLDASEKGIDKLTTMVQDLIKGDTTGSTEVGSQNNERLTNLETAVSNIEQTLNNFQLIASTGDEAEAQRPAGPGATPAAAVANVTSTGAPETEQKNGAEETKGTDEASKPATQPHDAQPAQRISLGKLLGGVDIAEMNTDVAALKTEVSQIRKNVTELSEKISRLPGTGKPATTAPAVATPKQGTGKEKGGQIEKQPENVEPGKTGGAEQDKAEGTEPANVENIKTVNAERTEPTDGSPIQTAEDVKENRADDIKEIHERIEKLERDLTCLSEKVDSGPIAGATGDTELTELVSKIQGIQTDVEKLNQTADHLIDDQENRGVHLNALLEQIELLKTIKADKEDLEDALADKADAQMMNRKVSYDQFDAACDDLARGLEDAIGKLGKQESIWQDALDEVQKEIEGKVDKIEISPLRDFVTDRLKSLQKKLKSVIEMKQDNEAAGTKKMLRDVQCISCDKNVVMKMEDTNKFRVEPLPCTMSMKPYLTYELDQVRKQQRRLPHSRNMIQFEAALQEEARKQKTARTEPLVKTPRDHLCNRYCGGSHTVTTPQQRVTRVGHFLSQWGPEVVQLTEGVVRGTDGRMYRSRGLPGKTDVCGPANCEDRGIDEEVRRSDRSETAVVTAPRKSVESQKRPSTGTAQRRRSSRKQSIETPIKEAVVEPVNVPKPPSVEELEESAFPIDTSSHADHVGHYDEDEEMELEDYA